VVERLAAFGSFFPALCCEGGLSFGDTVPFSSVAAFFSHHLFFDLMGGGRAGFFFLFFAVAFPEGASFFFGLLFFFFFFFSGPRGRKGSPGRRNSFSPFFAGAEGLGPLGRG